MAKAAAKTNASAMSSTAERRPALAGRSVSATGVKLEIMPPSERISLRAPEASLAALSKALGVTLPTKPKTSVTKAGRTALWLGPDEWLVIDEAGKDPLADCAKVSALHSAAINGGCPQDLSLEVFPVGAASRTILGKSEIVLLRSGPDAFRVECWRSFSDYVFTLLSEAASDAAA